MRAAQLARERVVWGIPVVLPALRDPRLRLSLVVVTLQVLGQAVLGFKVSIAQILVTVAVCAAIEVVVSARDQRALVWPASAILTGNSIAFILRANGTHHGDWWTLNGAGYFAAAAVLAMLSKYLIRPGGRHTYNPSNLGLVAVLIWFGPGFVYPQYLWWGPVSAPLIGAVGVIVVGGLWVLRPLGLLPMAAAFLATFGSLIGVFATWDACFVAIWSPSPVCGFGYFSAIALSPELLVFVLFMISDPKTAPATPGGRALYGVAVAVLAAVLIAFEPFEWGIKSALLGSLTIALAVAPRLDGFFGPAQARSTSPATNLALALVIVISVAVPIALLAFGQDETAINRDRVTIAVTLPNPQG